MEYFDNPFTAEKFEFSSKPIMVKVVQDDSTAQDRITHVYAGKNHSIALTEMGQLWSWGLGSTGQLGIPRRNCTVNQLLTKDGHNYSSLPLPILNLKDIPIKTVVTKGDTCYAFG